MVLPRQHIASIEETKWYIWTSGHMDIAGRTNHLLDFLTNKY